MTESPRPLRQPYQSPCAWLSILCEAETVLSYLVAIVTWSRLFKSLQITSRYYTMADVRSLLRNERASRRINHPQASYSSTGTLFCLVCHVQLKSESLWDTHLRSVQHSTQLQKTKSAKPGRPPSEATNGSAGTKNSKKRKAGDAQEEDGRKRTKPTNGLPQSFFDNEYRDQQEEEPQKSPIKKQHPSFEPTSTTATPHQTQMPSHPHHITAIKNKQHEPSLLSTTSLTNTIDEAEWAAFERDIALPPPPSPPLNASSPSSSHHRLPPAVSALSSSTATISAAPLSAAEIAARSCEEASTQGKEKREEELEGEKEDAQRRLEMEFEEMEGLEMRVKRLKDRWRELGGGKRDDGAGGTEGADGSQGEGVRGKATGGDTEEGERNGEANESDDDEDDEEEDDDEWNGWRL